jgi:integrase
MSRIKLSHVQQFIARGRVYYYFRKPGSERVRLPGLPGSAEFMTAYQLALDSAPRIEIGAGRTVPGSVSAVVARYYASADFKHLSPDTRRYRHNVIEKFRARFGESPIRLLQRPHLVAMAERIEKPFARKNWLKAMRAFLQYAVEIGMRSDDPSHGMKISLPKSDGWRTWGEEQIAIFRRHHPIGTLARRAFELLLNTAQRRGDVIRMGRQHLHAGVKGPVLRVRQSKTGRNLRIPVLPELMTVIEATPADNMTFLTTAFGRPFTAAGFGNWFREQCDACGLHGFSAHGLRKAACTRLADAGCTPHEIAAISGHRSLSEVARYTRDTDQEAMAEAAMTKMRTSAVKQADPALSNKEQVVETKSK